MQSREWRWTNQQILEYLSKKNAMMAMRGKSCPVAVKVVERLESRG